MKSPLGLAPAVLFLLASRAGAQLIVVEPDNYADFSVVNDVVPQVHLFTAGTNNLPHPPQGFDVTARTSTFPFLPPTGTNVFAHASVPFWNTDRRLRMDFAGPVSSVSIDFQGGTSLTQEVGRLEVYDAGGTLLEAYSTARLEGGQIETMTINRPSADIQWAVAYADESGFPFGRLDFLRFSTPVPEPSTWVLVSAGLGVLFFALKRRKH
jgi:hypothetical protein